VLRVERVGVHDNFFELGGHSLLAMRLVARVRDEFKIELPLRALFETPSAGALATRVEVAQREGLGLAVPALVAQPRGEHLPLSYAQERLWLLEQIGGLGSAYNVPASVRLRGALDVAALERSFTAVVERHEGLRTRFAVVDGSPVQVIDPAGWFGLAIEDLSELPGGERAAAVWARMHVLMRQPFDLERGPLLRAHLLRLSGEEHVAVVVMHHIVSDGWSIGVLIRELGALYAAFSQGRPSPLPALAVQYADYAAWQRGWLQGEVLEKQVSYWKQRLSGAPAALELPSDRQRPAVQSYRGAHHGFALPAELTASLNELARGAGATLFMVLLAAFKVVLGRWSGQEDIVVGSPIAGRTHRELEGLIGFFVNTLALRTELGGDPSFKELLQRVRETALGAYAHQDLPFEKLVAELQPVRDLSRQPIFQVLFALQNVPRETLQLPGLELRRAGGGRPTAKFDLALSVHEREGRLEGHFEYATDLFDAATIERLAGHLKTLLEGIVTNPDARLSELPLLSEAERHRLLTEWNDTAAVYPREKCLHELFAEQAERTSNAVAVVYEDQCLTYGELDRRSNQLGHHLRGLGVGSEVVVGLCVQRSLEMVVGLLGILKAGGAYLPLDPSYPRERLAYMLEDAGSSVLVMQTGLEEALPEHGARVVRLDRNWPEIAGEPTHAPASGAGPDNLAYVIYTSGSTGKPKGVMSTHSGIVNRLLWMEDVYRLTPMDRIFQKTPFSFDVSVWEFFWPLITGARLVVARPGRHMDPLYLASRIAAEQVTIMHFVPSMLRPYLEMAPAEQYTSLREVMCSGEALTPDLVRSLLGSSCVRVNNLYGPTEASVDVTMWHSQMRPDGVVPIGRPIWNTRVYVLDAALKPVPVGVGGELYIGGAGLARGYLGRGALTAERFVPSPYGDGERLYRTGDLVRYLPDGNLEFLGRLDHQVKLRGYRIELGEIEAGLLEHGSVGQAVVVAREDVAGDKRLVAYVVAADSVAPDAGELRAHLQRSLPDYMVPSAFVVLEVLPLTPNGKVDRKALPAPEGRPEIAEYVAPRTPTEEVLAGIWSEVLRVERVGVHDNFFELGGHSLLAMRLVARVRDEFKIELPLRALFETPSAGALATRVEVAQREGLGLAVPALVAQPRGEHLPLSYAQERLWLLEQIGGLGSAYNVPASVRLRGALDVAALERSFTAVVERHEGLRTRFAVVDGSPVQVIDPAGWFGLAIEDLSELPGGERAAAVWARMHVLMRQPFDLERGPLLRAHLLRLSGEEHVAVVVMHHIVSDGWSIGVLIRELGALYAAFSQGRPSPLPALAVQYADYAAWQRGWLQGEVLEKQVSYWKQRLSGAPAALELPSDRQRPAVQSYRGAHHGFALPAELTASLNELARGAGATLFMVLLAAFKVVLGRWSGQEDIVVGSPIAGRTHRELEGLIGFFVNTLALRTELGGDPSFKELLQRVRETALGAYAHQDLPFEKLVAELQPVRDLSRQPIFQVLFALQNVPRETLQLPGLELRRAGGGRPTAKFDLALSVHEREGRLEGHFEYATDLFDAATIERLAGHLKTLLEGIVTNPDARLSELPLLSEAERHRLLTEWNDTAAVYPREKCLHELFAEQAERTSNAVAVVYEDQCLTYGELDRRSNQLGHHLRGLGVGSEVVVGLCVQRSLEMVVGLLGILKAGGAYLPLDPEYPAERLAYMMSDARAPVVVTQAELVDQLPPHDARVVQIDLDWVEITAQPTTALRNMTLPDNLAYVLYTSGSTGQPKGVSLQHASAVAMLSWADTTFSREDTASTIASTSICFDLSIFELFVPLCTGGQVILANSPIDLPTVAKNATLINTVPSAIAELIRKESILKAIRVINLAGEPLQASLVRQLYNSCNVQCIYNLYGPSEDTTYSTYALIGRNDTQVPIGRPISNTRVYVLDGDLSPVPIGVGGELYIGGHGLARCYLGRAGLTADRFVPSSFGDGERLYRTGDLVRYLADGNLEFLGRIDHQVKLRGFRIELGEIETALRGHGGVKDAVVIAREDTPGDKRLVAYVVAADEAAVDAGDLRGHLKRSLPDYMVPSAFVMLKALPLTPNGKIDRRALPAPEDDAVIRGEYVEPRTPTEEVLAAIWCEVLKLDRVGVHDNFFELGGHSLLAMRLMARLRDAFQIELPLRALFEAPTVGEISVKLAQQQDLATQAARATEKMVAAMSSDQVQAMLRQLKMDKRR